ncbi:MAG: hypothetical protein K9L70_14935, partial [Thiohalocapsa sp.]|nr:hypothetical protein [Thiohalocapsa sp.]
EGIADLGYRARCVLAPTPAGALALAAVAPAETGISDDRYADRPDRDRGRANADRAAVDMADRPHGDQCSADALAARGLIADHDALRRALALLPVTVLGLDRREREDFDAMGLKRIGDLLRLPRGGLAERFGIERVQQLERLLGERPDPRHFFQPPQRFRAELQLPAEVPDSPALVFACRRLIDELGGFLLARQAGVQRLHWRLRHADSAAARFDLGAARIERDPERWLALLRERLERLRLAAPVRAVALVSETIRPLAPASGELFPEHAAAVDPDPALLDRLQARLGGNAVRGLMLLADHRPERAWRWCRPGEQGLHRRDGRQVRRRAGKARNADALPAADRAGAGPDPAHRGTGNRPLDAAWGADGPVRLDRPLWLLPEPMPLGLRNKRPWLDGPLDLGQGCERIETGWWDDFEVARDYYVATTVTGERLWIYREIYGARGWFLQGVFGGEY